MTILDEYKKIRVISVRGLSPRVRAIRFEFVDSKDQREFTFVPGSFVMIGVPGYGESPLTITAAPEELPEFEIAVRTEGNNTMALNRLKKGDTAYLRGPFGNSVDFKEIYGRELVIIAGGIGFAPLRSIVKHIEANPYTVSKLSIIYGVKDPEHIIYKEDFGKWKNIADIHITVDKADADWNGKVGSIINAIKELEFSKDASCIICGPSVMYKKVAEELAKKNLSKDNLYFMLERRMKCGIGKCQHCTCGDKYVCTDGPTFKLSEIENNWEALK